MRFEFRDKSLILYLAPCVSHVEVPQACVRVQAGVVCVLGEMLGRKGGSFQLEPIKVLRSFKREVAIPNRGQRVGFPGMPVFRNGFVWNTPSGLFKGGQWRSPCGQWRSELRGGNFWNVMLREFSFILGS